MKDWPNVVVVVAKLFLLDLGALSGLPRVVCAARADAIEGLSGDQDELDHDALFDTAAATWDGLRDKINDLRLKAQAAQMNEEQFRERLAEVMAKVTT